MAGAAIKPEDPKIKRYCRVTSLLAGKEERPLYWFKKVIL